MNHDEGEWGPKRVQLLDAAAAARRAEDVWRCYDAVFGDRPDFVQWRSQMYGPHCARDGFRLALATEQDAVIGFAWGYIGSRGQYWSDLVEQALPQVAHEWVGGHFEFVELAVLPSHRRHGLGQLLLDSLLADVDRRCLLSTSADEGDPAVRLYRRNGWQSLGLLRPDAQVMGWLPTG